ncbi:CHAT domain-containing tetratricopeptide repeat protein [uncultured Microscilla sp.]|uniref:CHAT domain-containing tetratricopeptide repeat protein n=1 Tax=uncultured Microscilla sp. TaxID=432653 RepID=UPI002625503F|nr:CHAT domain-containing tetratricopeptide repeat protein [uncultured Microscilla sp.]
MQHNRYVAAMLFWDKAAAMYAQSLRWQNHLNCQNKATECWWRLGKLTEARKLANKVIKMSDAYLGPGHLVASVAYNHLGVVDQMSGQYVEAIVHHQQALIMQKKALGINAIHPEIANTYRNLGAVSRVVHRYYKAEEYLLKSIAIARTLYGEAAAMVGLGYHYLGTVFHSKYAYSQALDYYYKATDIYQKQLPINHSYQADNYHSMGQALQQQGKYLSARIAFEKALKIYRKIYKVAHPSIALVLNSLAQSYQKGRQYKAARQHHQQALQMYKTIYGDAHPDIAQTYLDLGSVLISQTNKNYPLALQYFDKARGMQMRLYGDRHPILAKNYVYTGLAYFQQNKYQLALWWFQKSLVVNVYNFKDTTLYTNPPLTYYFNRKFLLKALRFKAESLHYLATQGKNKQQLLLALETWRLCDHLADRMQFDQQNRLDQLLAEERNQSIYQKAFLISAQIALSYPKGTALRQKFVTEAFYFSEKSKSQVLRKSMSELENQRKNLVADTLRQKDLSYRQQIAFFEQKLAQRSQGMQAQNYRNQLFKVKQSYRQWATALKKQYPRLHALRNKANLATLRQIQSRLYSKTAVVAYTMATEQSYAFVITASKVRLIRLGSTARLTALINDFYNDIQNENPMGSFVKASHQLYLALMRPLIPYLAYQNELVITEPTLLSVPMEALIMRKPPRWLIQKGQFNALQYLNHRFQIHYHYSASLWWLNQSGQTHHRPLAPVKFYGFAPFNQKLPANSSDEQLPNSGLEIKAIAQLFKNRRQASYTYLSTQATLGQFVNSLQEMPDTEDVAHILHIASHSTANLNEDRLARIHFAPQPQADSTYLYAESIYYLPLKAQLVVLSSCESGVGKFVPGEGVMSLARGFLHAGAKSVISSLWEADDYYTKKLMVLLYQNILYRRKNYTQALHAAKNQLIAQEPYLHPKYWSNFILIGR